MRTHIWYFIALLGIVQSCKPEESTKTVNEAFTLETAKSYTFTMNHVDKEDVAIQVTANLDDQGTLVLSSEEMQYVEDEKLPDHIMLAANTITNKDSSTYVVTFDKETLDNMRLVSFGDNGGEVVDAQKAGIQTITEVTCQCVNTAPQEHYDCQYGTIADVTTGQSSKGCTGCPNCQKKSSTKTIRLRVALDVRNNGAQPIKSIEIR